MSRVNAQVLGEEATEGVKRGIGGEQVAPPQSHSAFDQQQEAEGGQVPDRLVEERRLERPREQCPRRAHVLVLRRDARQLGLVGYAHCPRELGRQAEKLLVEVVAPASDGLSQSQRGCRHVEEGAQRDAHAPGLQPAAEHAAGDAAPNAETTVPDLEDLDEMASSVLLPARDDGVQPGTDQAGNDGPEAYRHDRPGVAAQPGPAPLRQPGCHQHGDGDQQPVEVQLEGPYADAVSRGAGDVGSHVVRQASGAPQRVGTTRSRCST